MTDSNGYKRIFDGGDADPKISFIDLFDTFMSI